MRIAYDESADAMYIYLADVILPGMARTTRSLDPLETGLLMNLDFNEKGRLIGIEILDASSSLPKEAFGTP